MMEQKKKRKSMKLPNGMGSVTKVEGRRRKKYRVRVSCGWTPDGKQIVKSLGYFTTRREALEALSQWNVNPATATDKIKKQEVISGMTFADAYRLMYSSREPKASDATLGNYRTAFNNLEPLHGQLFVALRKPQLQDAFDACEKSSATKAKMKNLVKAIYKYAIENEITDKDYSSMIDMETKKVEREAIPFTEAEIATLWEKANSGDDIAKIIILQIYSGTRIAELLELKKENVHISEQYAIGGKKTKAGTNRIIPLHDRTLPIWEYFYNQDRNFLFSNSRGMQMKYDGFGVNFRSLMDELGMAGHQTHDARRTCATRLSVADVPYHIISQILGHSTAGKSVTALYIKKDKDHLVKWINTVK